MTHPPESKTEYVHAVARKARDIAEDYREVAIEAGRNPGGDYGDAIEDYNDDLESAASFMFSYDHGFAPQTGPTTIEDVESAEALGRIIYWSFASFGDKIEGRPYTALKDAAREAIRRDLEQASSEEFERMKEKDGQRVYR